MTTRNLSDVTWTRSSFCNQVNDCVEAAGRDGAVVVRDSKDPDGPVLGFTPPEWVAFVLGVRRGEFDHLV